MNFSHEGRGIEKVRIEHNLVCTAHNLKIMWAKMTGKVAVLDKIGGFNCQFGIASELGNFFGFRAGTVSLNINV